MTELCDLQIRVNGEETFFVNESTVSRFSGKLRKIFKLEKRRTRATHLDLHDFPGGPDGFELVLRFCYSQGQGQGQSMFTITVSNVAVLHCCAVFLGMTEKIMPCNLFHQTEAFLESMFYWSWSDILSCLRSCGSFMTFADSIGLLQKLLCSLLAKIAQNSDTNLIASPSSPSSSSSSSAKTTPELTKPCSSTKLWWFDDLTTLPPKIIEKFIKTLGAYGADNSSLILTKFLLHYLNTTAVQSKGMAVKSRCEYGGLADTAVYGVVLMGKSSFSCRGMFWVLRVVSGFGLSRECRAGVERVIGGMLDQATLDDLLVCGHDGGAYDVNLVVRLVRVMVDDEKVGGEKMKRVGRLIDKYLCEISPDQNLKMAKFLGVAESFPDSARDCFDGVYRAIDIYLQSHPNLSWEGRSKLCGCLNYEKLSLEACKDLAKNPKIPPRIAVQALAAKAQQSNIIATKTEFVKQSPIGIRSSPSNKQMVLYSEGDGEESEKMRLNLQRMQFRVVELEKVCREMKGQMSRMVKGRPPHPRPLPRMC